MNTPVPDADAAEQRATPTGDDLDNGRDLPDVPDGAPEADVVEQAEPAAPGEHRTRSDLPLEADVADAAEQSVVVPLDEDEGRE